MAALANIPFKIILGSSSTTRRQILAEMGYEFTVMVCSQKEAVLSALPFLDIRLFFVWFDCDKSPGGCSKTADIDEKSIRKEKPEELVMVLAEAKADAIMSKLKASNYEEHEEPTLLITADQVVVHGGVIREKPSSKDEARQFIKGYSGRHAATVGSVVVTNLKTGVRQGGWDKAEIYFHEIPDEVVESLIEEGAVLYVAGGLMVEHPLTSPFVNAVVGTIDSVMGLSKDLTQKLIQEVL